MWFNWSAGMILGPRTHWPFPLPFCCVPMHFHSESHPYSNPIPIPVGIPWEWDSHGNSHSHTHLYCKHDEFKLDILHARTVWYCVYSCLRRYGFDASKLRRCLLDFNPPSEHLLNSVDLESSCGVLLEITMRHHHCKAFSAI